MFFDEAASVLFNGQITDITASDLTATVDVYVNDINVTTTGSTETRIDSTDDGIYSGIATLGVLRAYDGTKSIPEA